jgi:hypothetical protein
LIGVGTLKTAGEGDDCWWWDVCFKTRQTNCITVFY